MALILKKVGRKARTTTITTSTPVEKARKGLVALAARCGRWSNPDTAVSALAEYARKANNMLATKPAATKANNQEEEAYMAILLGGEPTTEAVETTEVATTVAATISAGLPPAIMAGRLETKKAFSAFFGLVSIKVEDGILDPILAEVFGQ